jgi:FkbM family methyltransferase
MIVALIFDIGVHRGEDTAYYLWQNHSVVAVDANPKWITLFRERVPKLLATGRLQVVHTAVSDDVGYAQFWIPEDNPQWASLHQRIAQRESTVKSSIWVNVTTLAKLIDDYGVPDYLKIDIEASDCACLSALPTATLPQFISIESECLGTNEIVDEEECVTTLRVLHSKGYTRFMLIDQYTLCPITWELLCPLRQSQGANRGDLQRSTGWRFPFGATGPWGERLEGRWMDIDEAAQIYLASRKEYFALPSAVSYGYWCDWHAKVG